MKKTIIAITFLISVFSILTGCVSTSVENILTFSAEVGQTNYIRRTVLKTKNSLLTSADLDVTYAYKDGKILDAPTVNYTFTFVPDGYELKDSSFLKLVYEGKELTFTEPKVLYKDIDKKKNLCVRCSVKTTEEEFENVLKGNSPVEILLQIKDKQLSLDSTEFNEKINDARVIF